MTQPELLVQLNELVAAAEQAFANAANSDQLEAIRVEFLGAKSGRIKTLQKQLGSVPPDQRPVVGKRFNEVKDQIEQAFRTATERAGASATAPKAKADSVLFDTSLPGLHRRIGKLHPITQTIDELQDLLGRLGFTVVGGPEIEDEWHNFDALNIPADHPARDPLDNFYLATAQKTAGPLLMRSQTSTVQIRVMEQTKPPVRVIALGRVYRPDEADRTHYPMFHQMEGLLVDRHVTMADLKSVLRLFASSYLGHDVHIRFRPSFFPFTEPSVEVDMSWNDGWMEIGGAGMVDPNVLRAVGYDPEQVSGFAFGFGVERMCMRRHAITDIREFYRNDVRFLRQF